MPSLGLGEIEKVHSLLIEFLKKENVPASLTFEEKFKLYQKFKLSLQNQDDNYDIEVIIYLFDKLFDQNYKFNKKPLDKITVRHFEKQTKYKSIDELNNSAIKVPKKYQKKWDQFIKLYNTPQPAQRTPEWYKYREERITASDAATAIGEHAKEKDPNKLIIKKCDSDFFPFEDNIFCHHGKKYEPIATMIYEHIENVKITEFGCLPHPTISYLGASPDGICSKSTLDHKFSPLLGRMLEIKCPYSRAIKMEGKVDDGICPHYYYLQVLLQIECCDLDECDFIQCRLTEYDDRIDYLNDPCENTEHYRGEYVKEDKVVAKPITMNKNWLKGCILQFIPKNKLNDNNRIFSAEYIYPPSLDLSTEEYDKWTNETICNLHYDHPNLMERCVFDKVLYWRLEKTHVVLIKRDEKWFTDTLPKFKDFWDKVLYYRGNPSKIDELKQKYKKFKYDTTLNISTSKVMASKKLFLNEDENPDIDFMD